jgi:flagellin FlaB
MFENIHNDEERGQVGIGTLIVFIALVLVAAIAAGVLINTAGFLQNQAESTGQESSDQVTNGVQVIGATGSVDTSADPNVVDTATLTVSLSPGADPVELDDASIEYLGASAASFDGVDDGDAGISFTTVEGSGSTLADSGDKIQITLDPGTGSKIDTETLEAGDSVEVTIITASGSKTTETLNVPNPLTDDKNAVML